MCEPEFKDNGLACLAKKSVKAETSQDYTEQVAFADKEVDIIVASRICHIIMVILMLLVLKA